MPTTLYITPGQPHRWTLTPNNNDLWNLLKRSLVQLAALDTRSDLHRTSSVVPGTGVVLDELDALERMRVDGQGPVARRASHEVMTTYQSAPNTVPDYPPILPRDTTQEGGVIGRDTYPVFLTTNLTLFVLAKSTPAFTSSFVFAMMTYSGRWPNVHVPLLRPLVGLQVWFVQ